MSETGPYPLTRDQRDIYFEQLLHPGHALFHVGATIFVHGVLDISLFLDSVREVYRVWPDACSYTGGKEGAPVQCVPEHGEFNAEYCDLRAYPDARAEAIRQAHADFGSFRGFGGVSQTNRQVLFHLAERHYLWYTRFHHLFHDGWSCSLLYQEIVARYNAALAGSFREITERPRFSDYAAEDRAYQDSAAFARHKAYWEERFPDEPAPLFQARGPIQFDAGRESFSIPRVTYNRMASFCAASGFTSFHFLLAVLILALANRRGTADIPIALPILNRRSAVWKKCLGLFVSMSPFRVNLDLSSSFEDLVRAIGEQLRRDYRHQRYTLGDLMRRREEGGASGHLVDVSFSYEKHDYDLHFTSCRNAVSPISSGQQSRPLQTFVREYDASEDVAVDFDYNLSYINHAEARQLVETFAGTLESALANPGVPLIRFLERALVPSGGPVRVYPVRDLGGWFEEVARERGEAVALVCEDRRVSYAELNGRANAEARWLREQGVGPEVRVGLCRERSLDLIIGMLAIVKAGGVYVPMDPQYPAERLAYLAHDSGVALVLKGEAPETWAQNLGITAHPLQAAYVIYTSGSTGHPKGCVLTHANVSRLLDGTRERFGFVSQDVWTMFHSPSFDFSVWEIWGALLTGARLVIVPYLVSRSPEAFWDLLRKEEVTILNQTPSAFRQLIALEEARLPKLRLVIFGGEALDTASLEPWFARYGTGAELVNMYGITETTVHVTEKSIVPGAGNGIGAPLPDLTLYVLDEAMQQVPIGVSGEIYVGGAGVARGYLGRPALTAERFVPDPFHATGGRLYRSGDRARWRAEGEPEYLGRGDQQIKIRGFRIEPGEIEAVLRQCAGVREAIVGELSGRLVAWVVAEQPQTLRAQLQATLPEYMVPAAIVPLPSIPLTAHGKVDRRALPEPDWTDLTTEASHREPRTEAERTLAAIWTRVLGAANVGIGDNFFALGGDSILALQVITEAREMGLELDFKDLYERPTIVALLASPASQPETLAADPLTLSAADSAKLPADAEDAFPLCSLQAGMLFHSELTPNGAMFHDYFIFDLRMEWSEERFRKALRSATALHPALRTTFHWDGYSVPLQVIHRTAEIPLQAVDLTGISESRQKSAIAEWAEVEKLTPFDLRRAPLLRTCVHLLGPDRVSFALSFHHAILDGWSVASLVTEIFGAYFGRSLPQQPTNAFRSFVADEQKSLADPEALDYWRRQLADMPSTLLTASAKPVLPREVHRHDLALEAEWMEALKQLSQRDGIPLKTLLLSVHAAVLGFASGSARAVTGYVTHSRPTSEALGLFLNTVPLCSPSMDCSWKEFTGAMFDREKELIEHRAFPLVAIKQLAGGVLPFDTAFNFVHFHVYEGILNLPGMEVNSTIAFEETDFPLLAQFIQHPDSGKLELVLIHDRQAVSDQQVESLAQLYRQGLQALVATSEASVMKAFVSNLDGAFSCLREYPVRDLGGWFEEVAWERGDAVALVCEDRRVSYAELNGRANAEARWLREQGVGPEVRVGLCRERSLDLIIGMLAIVKAGGVYVPMDPQYPAERLNYLAHDSGVALVLKGEAPQTSAENLGVAAHPSQAAYVIYTSGSTGLPKGCVVTHANVSRLLDGTRERFGFVSQDVWTMFHSPSFDFSVWEIWGALLTGARLVIVPYLVSRSPEAFWDLLRKEEVTILNQTPSAFRQLIALEEACLPKLRLVIFGGEALDTASLEPWFARYGTGAELVNMYGITETTVHVTEKSIVPGAGNSIGGPLPDLTLYVLDGAMQQVPIGVSGEIYVGGAGVARGYLGRAALTAERFVPDPFHTTGGRLYRSGDRARWRAEGELEYLGRGDQQIKIRGFRIEPGEIEAALRQCAGVGEAVVGELSGRLVAWVVAEQPQTLRAQLQATLPEYMVPAAIVPLPSIPLTPHGKVDRRALPEPDWTSSSIPYLAPSNDVEAKLAALYSEVLGMEQVGTRHNFFEMGGNSISATRLVARIRTEFGSELPLRTFFETHDILSLARVLGTSVGPAHVSPPQIKRTARELVSVVGTGLRD